jgi:dinuclear metal center YbgI/SA1388 family protein
MKRKASAWPDVEAKLKLLDIVAKVHDWIPPETAQSYDNVGLQVGDREATITTGLVALDLTPQVLDEAIATGCDLIVTHHPLLFKSLRQVDAGDFIGGMVHRLAANGISLVSAHTNLDSAANGVSARLADLLGLVNIQFLQPLPSDLVKLVTYVPVEHSDAVRTAVTDATDQTIGPYRDVAFQSAGEGFFRPLEDAVPFIGSPGGEVERVEERRLEVTLSSRNLAAAIAALKEVHPYETVAYDVFSIDLKSEDFGLGMIGDIPDPIDLSTFLNRICSKLSLPVARYVGRPQTRIGRVAVCGGSGGDLIETASRSGADAFVTSDLSYHTFFDVLDATGELTMALIDAGHYETEAETEALLTEWLTSNIPDVSWSRTTHRTSPIQYHIDNSALASNS